MIDNLFARIRTVDMDGFCGRENHPEASDVGKIVRVDSIIPYTEDADPRAFLDADVAYTVIHARDGERRLELMWFEVELMVGEPMACLGIAK